MKPFLLRVERPFEDFRSLVAALRQAGERCGWLDLSVPAEIPATLDAAARGGVLRAVAAGGGRQVAVKPMRGAPVLRDVLREHFRGCRLVLVRATAEALGGTGAETCPHLAPTGDGWTVGLPGVEPTSLQQTTEQAVMALRRPRPWGVAAPDFRLAKRPAADPAAATTDK